jgi:hypothetical protein
MTWLVFGVSCLLVLAGAVSIISGAPIIQLERGWAEVISGTVALASGGVVFGLAVVLVRLENLREILAARADMAPQVPESLPVARPVAPLRPEEPIAASAPVEPDPVALEPAAAEPEPVPTAEHGLWKRIRRPAERAGTGEMEAKGFPDRIVPDEPAQSEAEAPVIVPPHPTPEVSVQEPAGAPEPAAASEPGQIGWLERSLLKGRGGKAPRDPEMPAVEPVLPSLFGERGPDRNRPEPSFAPAPTLASPSATDRSEPRPALEPDPTPDLAAERHEGVSVIGRYQAGTSSYVMYSDGTIEVETEDGQVHRFGSMDELKAYIASQDTAAT